MTQPSSSQPYGLPRQEDDEDSVDDLIDDEEADPNEQLYPDSAHRADQVSRALLFLVQELGSFKKNAQGEEVYVPGPTCDKALQDLVKYCRQDKPDDPLVKYYLGKYASVKKDLLPLFLSQTKNKRLLYHLLTLLAHLTAAPEKRSERLEEHQGFLEDYKELLAIPEFADVIVAVLGNMISTPDKTKFHDNMVELIITVIRNVLQIDASVRTLVDTYKESLQLKLYISFSKEGGVFDALTFLCQDMKGPLKKRLRFVFLEIYYYVLSTFPPAFLFGQGIEEQYFKNLREREKIARLKRLGQISTRHSRFGAMFQYTRKIGGTAAVTSNINFRTEDLNKLDVQRNKPKPNKRYASKEGQLGGNKFIEENHGVLSEEEKQIQIKLKHFVADFLEHAYGPLIDSLYDELSKEASGVSELDFEHFFTVTAFGVECYVLEFEKSIASMTPGTLYSRAQVEEKMTCKLQSLISGIQVTLLELLYKSLLKQVAKKKADFNIPLYYSLLQYFAQILQATNLLSNSTQPNDQKNAKLLKQVIFTREFGKVLKIGLNHYEPRLHSITFGQGLIRVTDIFFTLLGKEAKDKVITAKTDRMVRRALKRTDQRAAVKSEAAEEGDALEEEELDDEEADDGRELLMAQERKYNYFSEFCSFVDYPTVQKIVLLIRGERLLWNPPKLNAAVTHFIQRVVEDVGGDWVFFQHDFLNYFNEILSNPNIVLKSEYSLLVGLVRRVIKSFFQALSKNPCLVLEANMRFPDVASKDRALNNYDLPDPTLPSAQPALERHVLPWSREEDMILVENYSIFKDDPKLLERLSDLLRDQAYFREPKEVRLRVRLLKLEKSKETALQLVQQTHTEEKVPLSAIITRILLSTTVLRIRSLESALLYYLDGVQREYEAFNEAFPLTPSSFPIIPKIPEEFEVHGLDGFSLLLKHLGAELPSIGKVYPRIPPGVHLQPLLAQLREEYEKQKNFTEADLLELDEQYRPNRRAQIAAMNAASGGQVVKKNKKNNAQLERRAAREEMLKANRELAGLDSSDEEIPLEFNSSDEEVLAPRRINGKISAASKSSAGDFREEFKELTNKNGGQIGGDKEGADKKFRRLKKPAGRGIEEEPLEVDN